MRGDGKRDEDSKIYFKKSSMKQTYSQLKLTTVPVTAAITIQWLRC